MLISLNIDRDGFCLWHQWLADALTALPDTRVTVRFVETAYSRPSSVKLLLALDETVLARVRDHALTYVPFDGHSQGTETSDVVIQLAHGSAPQTSQDVIEPLFDDHAGELALLSALLDRRAPDVSIFSSTNGTISAALPALENPNSFVCGANNVLARTVQLLVAAVTLRAKGREHASPPASAHQTVTASSVVRFSVHVAVAKCQNALRRLVKTAPQWAVVWRHPASSSFDFPKALDPRDFRLLHDDGLRYYADPFPIAAEGRTAVFVEELPHKTGKGIISVSELQPDGSLSPPRPVLETSFHLSYPQVFERDGDIWMLPESAASGQLTLYRCRKFPDQWEPHAVLLQRPLHDATLFEHSGRLWIAATETFARSSSWDALSLFSAERLVGPWHAHKDNPVLLDVRSARPAGGVFERSGFLWRPAQDCRGAYGSGLTVARISELNEKAFAQTVDQRVTFAAESGIHGPHTLNIAAGLETLDAFATRKRLQDWFS